MMAQSRAEITRDTYNYGQYINQFPPNTIKVIREFERIQKKICRHKMSIMFNEICINEEMLPKYTYIYIYIFSIVTQKRMQIKIKTIYIYIYKLWIVQSFHSNSSFIILFNLRKAINALYHNYHNHEVERTVWVSPTLSSHPFLSSIAPDGFSKLHPMSVQNWFRLVLACQTTLARPCVGVHKRPLLVGSFLLLQHVVFVFACFFLWWEVSGRRAVVLWMFLPGFFSK